MKRSAFDRTARQLAAIGKRFYSRGWALGTSGHFSAVVNANRSSRDDRQLGGWVAPEPTSCHATSAAASWTTR
jgi:ribulose-5-phosphate 4-epimerase/fuculose-1-phosphate aldolase